VTEPFDRRPAIGLYGHELNAAALSARQREGVPFNATRASNKNFGNDSISVYGTPAAPVVTAGQPLFAPSTARFGGPRQIQFGLRTFLIWRVLGIWDLGLTQYRFARAVADR
jgi:hypothetical protein